MQIRDVLTDVSHEFSHQEATLGLALIHYRRTCVAWFSRSTSADTAPIFAFLRLRCRLCGHERFHPCPRVCEAAESEHAAGRDRDMSSCRARPRRRANHFLNLLEPPKMASGCITRTPHALPLPFLSFFFFPPPSSLAFPLPLPPAPAPASRLAMSPPPCISFIMSLNRFSLTPPPVMAGL